MYVEVFDYWHGVAPIDESLDREGDVTISMIIEMKGKIQLADGSFRNINVNDVMEALYLQPQSYCPCCRGRRWRRPQRKHVVVAPSSEIQPYEEVVAAATTAAAASSSAGSSRAKTASVTCAQILSLGFRDMKWAQTARSIVAAIRGRLGGRRRGGVNMVAGGKLDDRELLMVRPGCYDCSVPT